MPEKRFVELSKQAQIHRMRKVAEGLSARFGHAGAKLQLLNHGYNTTFRLDDAEGRKFALRINVNSTKKPQHMEAEIEWVKALAADGFPVPIPQKGSEGYVLTAEDSPTGEPLHAVMYSWLRGSNVGRRIDPPLAERIGKLTADLHRHAAQWSGPKVGHIDEFPDWLFFMPWVLDSSGLDVGVFRESLERANAATNKLRSSPRIVVHFDLHTANLRLYRGKLSVFDFDDILLGWPALDAAISVFHNRRNVATPLIEEAYWKGLGSRPTDWGITDADFEAMVAGRMVLLVNDIFQNNNAEIAALAKPYGEVAEKRLRHFLKTGVFDPTVAEYKP